MSEENLPARRSELLEFIERINVKETDPLKLEKMLDVFERMQRLQAESSFNDALARAQAKMTRVRKDKKNPLFGSTYASYAAHMDACEDALQSEGIVMTFGCQPSGEDSSSMIVSCFLSKGMHSKQESLPVHVSVEGPRGGRAGMTDAQARGSAITYARKQLAEMVLNLTPDDRFDDDGNTAGVSPDDIKRLLDAFRAIGVGKGQIERRVGRSLDTMRTDELAALRRIYVSLRSEESKSEDWFLTEKEATELPAKGNAGLKAKMPRKLRKESEAPDGRPNVAEPADGGVAPGADLPDDPVELVVEHHFDELSSELSWPELERRTMAIIGSADLADVEATRTGLEEHAVKTGSPIVYARLISALNEREKALKS